jgi:hypothetical protein
MLIIVDKKIPEEAKINLRKYGNLLELETVGLTYPSISGHPDIFFIQIDKQLVVAPNLPSNYFEILNEKKIAYQIGENPVGATYPETAKYNAVVSSKYLVHNSKITDPIIQKRCEDKISIHVNQGYTRCNLIFVDENHAITSDIGIAKILHKNNVETCFVSPHGIDLPGFKNGFFGGCCGVYQHKLFVLGKLTKYPEGEKVREFVGKLNIQIIALCNTVLFDGGGVLFIS